MKISKLQLIIIIIIVLLVIIIMLSPRSQQKPNIITPKTEAPTATEGPSTIGKYELPPKQENPAQATVQEPSVNTPAKKPSEPITGVKPPVKPSSPTQEAPALKEETEKFNKTPPPERLHEMQQKGILIY